MPPPPAYYCFQKRYDVFLTDLEPVLPLIRSNVSMNGLRPTDVGDRSVSSPSVSVSALDWGKESANQWAKSNLGGRSIDLLVGADLVVPGVYDSEALFETIEALSTQGTSLLLVSKARRRGSLDALYTRLHTLFREVKIEKAKTVLEHPGEPFYIVFANGPIKKRAGLVPARRISFVDFSSVVVYQVQTYAQKSEQPKRTGLLYSNSNSKTALPNRTCTLLSPFLLYCAVCI